MMGNDGDDVRGNVVGDVLQGDDGLQALAADVHLDPLLVRTSEVM